jgi:uncharacterized protein YndB with AHSA1/START domain
MFEPLVVEFTVEAEPSQAFDLWANRTSLWWPRGHTMSGTDEYEIIFEGWPGGRVFERSGEGEEHDWGEVLTWEPPNRIRYLWHLFFDRSEATTVDVQFKLSDAATTTVTITQTGFERLGEAGPPRRERTGNAWAMIAELFEEACRR